MTRKKRLKRIVSAVKDILGNEVKTKKLKKARALKRFIEKMQHRTKIIRKALDVGKLKKGREKELQRNLETLNKQIKKAKKILKQMNAESE